MRQRSALVALVALLVAQPAAAAIHTEVSTGVRVASAYGVVTSTFRSAQHNEAVGGVPNSFHLQGRALDVARHKGVTHQMVTVALRSAGLTLVEAIDEGDHSHFAFAIEASGKGSPARLVRSLPASPPFPIPSGDLRKSLLADEHGVLRADVLRVSP